MLNPFDREDAAAWRFLVVCALFALFGGVSRFFYRLGRGDDLWPLLTALPAAPFAGVVLGMWLADPLLATHPMLLGGFVAAAGWGGGRAAEAVTRRLLDRVFGFRNGGGEKWS
jgi:hypothetical protein